MINLLRSACTLFLNLFPHLAGYLHCLCTACLFALLKRHDPVIALYSEITVNDGVGYGVMGFSGLLIGEDNDPKFQFGYHCYPCHDTGMNPGVGNLKISVYVFQMPSKAVGSEFGFCTVRPIWPELWSAVSTSRGEPLP